MIFKIIGIVIFLLGVSLLGMLVKVLIKKDGKFTETHIGRNPNMKERGIHCVNTMDRLERDNYKSIEIK